jgi:AcrR family transcriptional regulator
VGLAGARIEEIARRSQTSKQLIYYYYGSKAGLYGAAVAALTLQVRSQTDEQIGATNSWMEQMLETQSEWMTTPIGDLLRRFLMWEALGNDEVEPEVERDRQALSTAALEGVRTAQRNGELDANLDTEMLALVVFGMLMFPYVLPQLTERLTGESPSSEAFRERFGDAFAEQLGRLAPAQAHRTGVVEFPSAPSRLSARRARSAVPEPRR